MPTGSSARDFKQASVLHGLSSTVDTLVWQTGRWNERWKTGQQRGRMQAMIPGASSSLNRGVCRRWRRLIDTAMLQTAKEVDHIQYRSINGGQNVRAGLTQNTARLGRIPL